MPIKVPKVVTGKWIARLISRSRLRWNSGSLWNKQNNSYCALGLIARHAGVNNEAIMELGEPDTTGPVDIPGVNDACKTKRQVVKAFCKEHGRVKFRLGPWIKQLKQTERELREEREEET